ncbi:hypothetical protein M409DRAFT_70467 [Zasmidium cellare ATCC 36951]|uniref:tetrahydrofolate synthase n=1 Tax=Zasmidium cellare ATCC 36951 TaxID=1080233 RepID=A0A6A6C3S5_ZASCE|nr:uncharacterized protein M409DRAFT_70467 [Zasmidium cellare ATCC 36951]KAF2160512.1 hypothetical protein M409DRAFT_70467 [Zasmidium cellare ATCC 36951]
MDGFPGGNMEGERNYEGAIQIINARRRAKRPLETNAGSNGIKSKSAANPTPDARGTPGIEGMSSWLQALGHSQEDINRLNVIHVAGTKGKGSTCAFTETFLRAHGQRTGFPKKTGLYTSPHLIVPEERIRIDARPLEATLFAKYFFEMCERLPQIRDEFDPSKEVVQRGPRYLQLFALLAFHTFIREGVDVAIFETHCGGEYDATNIGQRPVVTAVTTLGMDHIDMLGPTIKNIAWHKGGIYKAGAVALSAPQDPPPAEVLKQRSEEKGEQIRFVEIDQRLPQNSLTLRPEVQMINASVAATAAQAFLDRCAPEQCKRLTEADLKAGVEQFSWPGRFQILSEQQWMWYLDAAHNDMSVKIAAKWFAEICGDARTYDESDAKKSHQSPERPELFREAWQKINPDGKIWSEPTIQGAVKLARQLGPDGMHTLITGSQHLVGPSLRILNWSSKMST